MEESQKKFRVIPRLPSAILTAEGIRRTFAKFRQGGLSLAQA